MSSQRVTIVSASEANEATFTCVQCGSKYQNSTNGEGSCSFHTRPYDSWSRKQPCCGNQNAPCQRNTHHSEHHSDFRYASFNEYVWNMVNYSDTLEDLVVVKDPELGSTAKAHQVRVATVKRFKTRTALIPEAEQCLLVSVGARDESGVPPFFRLYSPADLQEIQRTHQEDTLIYKHDVKIVPSPEEEKEGVTTATAETAAHWVIGGGKLLGVRCLAQASTSTTPQSMMMTFASLSPPTRQGGVVIESRGGIVEKDPTTPHTLPDTKRAGPCLSNPEPPVSVKTDFKSFGPNAAIRLLHVKGKEMAIARGMRRGADSFEGSVSVLYQGTKGTALTITDITAKWKRRGEAEWKEVKECSLAGGGDVPFSCDAGAPTTVGLLVVVDCEEKSNLNLSSNDAYIAMRGPIRIRTTIHDVDGTETSIDFEYANKPLTLATQAPEDLFFQAVDDVEAYERLVVRCKAPRDKDVVAEVSGCNRSFSLKVTDLRTIVFCAQRNKITEVHLPKYRVEQKSKGLDVWALVDLGLSRVYALKIASWTSTGYAVGYYRLPIYQENMPDGYTFQQPGAAAPTVAHETAPLPKITTVVDTAPTDVPRDDPDDFVVVEGSKGSGAGGGKSGGGGGGDGGNTAALEARLCAIEKNTDRIASALETIAVLMTKGAKLQ